MKKKKPISHKTPQPISKALPIQNESIWKEWKYFLPILAITLLILSSSIPNDFVNWDDDKNVYENKLVTELNLKNIKAIFTTRVIGNYNPLTIFSFAIEHHFFGMNPKVMHINNVILHLFCTFFVFLIVRKLHKGIWVAIICAVLFGIHPMRIESVAWITERKDVLFGFFFLWALFLYIKNLETPSFTRSLFIFVLFILGLFSKIQMVTLPLSFLAVDYLRNRPLHVKLIFEKWHFFLASLLFGVLGIIFLKEQGSLDTNTNTMAGLDRIFIGSYSFITYIIKWLIPYRMIPLYPYPEKISLLHYISLPVALALLYFLYVMFKKNKREIVFGSLFFIFNIMFLLQILGAGQGYLADRFTYIAYLGLFFIAAHYFQYYYDKYIDYRSTLLSGCGIYLMALAFLSYRQGRFWKNSDTLWSRVIEYYDNTSLPFNNRANYLRDMKNFDAALQDYNKAISLKAGHSTYNSRAKLFFIKNEDHKALQDYNKAIEMSPNNAEYYVNRGAAYAKLGRLDEAIIDFNKGLAINPNWKVGYLNRSIMYNQLGNFSAALADINKYLQFEPKDAELWYEGGRCLRALNQNQKAIEYYSRAISLKPKIGLFFRERGIAHKLLGNRDESLRDLNMARQLGEIIEPSLMQ